mmetsp:Transcript_8200/g.21779  ORF Transcript_8200/g.21779 Transcript_8200/m.21779 type:complete len:105 (+) Transcript_8200:196-510(+)
MRANAKGHSTATSPNFNCITLTTAYALLSPLTSPFSPRLTLSLTSPRVHIFNARCTLQLRSGGQRRGPVEVEDPFTYVIAKDGQVLSAVQVYVKAARDGKDLLL